MKYDGNAAAGVGIFAQRGRNQPNRLGSTIVRVLGVADRVLGVAEPTPSTARPCSTSNR